MPDALVRHFMTEAVKTVAPGSPIAEVARQMHGERISGVVVCEDDTPVGVITERDMTRVCLEALQGRGHATAAEVMSPGLWTLSTDATCSQAADIMRERSIRRLVVVDDHGRLHGIVTQSDMLRAHTHELEIQKSLLEERVAERTRELAAANARLESMARIDPMLEIGNRRAMDEELEKLDAQARRYARLYSVALLDVDFFKKYNDHYGHGAGDEVLQRVARTLKRSIRAADSVFRYGGEEFLLLFPEVSSEGAAIAAEHARGAIEALAIPHDQSPFGHVSVSIGVASERAGNPCGLKLVTAADEALYEAKSGGRNRVETARAQMPEPL